MHGSKQGGRVASIVICLDRQIWRTFLTLLAIAATNTWSSIVCGEEPLTLHRETVIRFATESEATKAFQSVDRFIRSMSEFDLQCRLDRSSANTDEFLEFSANQYVPWTEEQKRKIVPVVQSLEKRLARFNLPLPKTVLLVQTSGKIEANAAYCRENAIMLPPRFINAPAKSLESLLAHELFHVLSSHNPDLRYRLYRIIGFQSCPPIKLPAALMARKITNPDAPQLDCILYVVVDGETVPATPFLWAKSDYEPGQGKTFFDYLQFRLLVLKPAGDGFEPLFRNGEPWFIRPRRPDLYWNIGINTEYIIHPEEILADNFKALVMKSPVNSPRITQAMLRELQQSTGGNETFERRR
jgi:hypothetical protein